MKITRWSNHLSAGTVVSLAEVTRWDSIGIVIHPATLPEGVEVTGNRDGDCSIIRTANGYIKLYPHDEVRILVEPPNSMTFHDDEARLSLEDKAQKP